MYIRLNGDLNSKNITIRNGQIDPSGQIITTSGDFKIERGGKFVTQGLGGSTINATGDLDLWGKSNKNLNLNPSSEWYINTEGSGTAEYAKISNLIATPSIQAYSSTDYGTNTSVAFTGCAPQSYFGPFEHTLFLGCSVLGCTASVGWNEQVGELTVELVKDTCPGTKVYYNAYMRKRSWSSADPGFIGLTTDIIGMPVYFRIGNFEFSGLVQSWEESSSTSANPKYIVKIVDPRQILEKTQIIINDYAGPVYSSHQGSGSYNWFDLAPYNIFNVFGFLEAYGGCICPQSSFNGAGYVVGNFGPDGAIFGTPAGGYGGSYANNNGMQFSRIVEGLNILINAVPSVSNDWSPYGRVVFRGSLVYGNGLLKYDRLSILDSVSGHSGYLCDYFVDLSELPVPPNYTYWRANGTNLTIMDLINQICEASGYDYYIELIPVNNATALSPSGVAKFIKVRTVRRNAQPIYWDSSGNPLTTPITTFIGESEGLMESTRGFELRNETTSAFIIGGNKQVIYQIEQSTDPEGDGQPNIPEMDDVILPYFGLDDYGNVIIPRKMSVSYDVWEFQAPVSGINLTLELIHFDNDIMINETELRASLDTFEAFETTIRTLNTDLGQLWKAWDHAEAVHNLAEAAKAQKPAIQAGNPMQPHHQVAANKKGAIKDVLGPGFQEAQLEDDRQTIYQWVLKYAEEYYGKKFQVRVPYTCNRLDNESYRVFTSEEPSDSGWTEQTSIISLPNPGPSEFFRLSDGKLQGFVRFSNGGTILRVSDTDGELDLTYECDISQLNEENYTQYNNNIYVKCVAHPDFVYVNKYNRFSPRIIIEFDDPIPAKVDTDTLVSFDLFIKLIDSPRCNALVKANKALWIAAYGRLLAQIANDQGRAGLDRPLLMPDAVAIPLRSNIATYGPWVSPGPAGQIKVERDEGLVPWEYNGVAAMNLAGWSRANEGLVNMQVGEMGSVTLPGYPEIPLGAELGAVAGGYYGGGSNLAENRSYALGSWNGTHITNGETNIEWGSFDFGGGWAGLWGPNITSINVGMGTHGIQTSYDFRTFTPKFGTFSRVNAERLKAIADLRRQQQEIIRGKLSSGIAMLNRKAVLRQRRKQDSFSDLYMAKSPHSVLVGRIDNWNSFHITTSTTSEVKEVMSEFIDYDKKAFMSLDGIIRPISMDGGNSENNTQVLPMYAKPIGNCQTTHPQGAQPPVEKAGGGSTQYDLSITLDYLNPFSNPAGLARSDLSSRANSYYGHDMDMIGRGVEPPDKHLSMLLDGYEDNAKSDYEDDYRMFALRGPLIIGGWGYDLDGKPIPNSVDVEGDTRRGIFKSTSLTDKFANDWLRKPYMWPVAPVDLRFDRQRGCWVSPPEYRLAVGQLTNNLSAYGSQTARLIEGDTLYDENGTIMMPGTSSDAPQFTVWDKVGNALDSGDKIIAYYDPKKCKYYVIECMASGSGSNSYSYGDLCPAALTGDPYGNWTGLYTERGLKGLVTEGNLHIALSMNVNGPNGSLIQMAGFNFGNGFNVSSTDACTAIINYTGESGLMSYNTTCASDLTGETTGYFENIEIDAGLKGTVENGTLKLALALDVDGNTNLKAIDFSDCFVVTTSNCRASVDLTGKPPGGAQNVTFVQDVYCSGTAIVVDTNIMRFSACGLFQGTGLAP